MESYIVFDLKWLDWIINSTAKKSVKWSMGYRVRVCDWVCYKKCDIVADQKYGSVHFLSVFKNIDFKHQMVFGSRFI